MTKSGYLLVLATVLASPLSADRPAPDRREHEHDGQCGHDQPGNGGGHGRHRSVCGAVSVSVPERPRARDPFSVRKTLDLQFRMRLRTRDEEAPHAVSFRVLTPSGRLYQQLQAPPEVRENKDSDDDNDDHDDRDRRMSRVSARLPVAGTFIVTSSLFGKWRVVPYVDDDPEPCAAPSVFRIVQ
jgi:hypothetical protein